MEEVNIICEHCKMEIEKYPCEHCGFLPKDDEEVRDDEWFDSWFEMNMD